MGTVRIQERAADIHDISASPVHHQTLLLGHHGNLDGL